MMNLEEANKVLESLTELSACIEDFSWGPSQALAEKRQNEAIQIIKAEIKELEHIKKKYEVGASALDSIEECEKCGSTFVWRMAGGGECSNPDCNHAEICF